MTVRSDLLRVCNDQGVALDDFKRAFCDRCLQPECTRSRVGTSKFEHRVEDWNEKLFLNPPRLDPHDLRYAQITGQRFLMIDPGPVPEVCTTSSAWIDPRDLSDQNPTPPAQPKVITTPNRPVAETPKSVPPVPVEKADLFRVASINTPIQASKMIGNVEKPALKADPWAGSETPSPTGEKVMTPGTKVRLGGGSGSGV